MLTSVNDKTVLVSWENLLEAVDMKVKGNRDSNLIINRRILVTMKAEKVSAR